MGKTLRARVRGGVLEPLEKIDLPEGKEVVVSIEEVPERTEADRALARAWGGWKGLVDADALIRELYELRLRPGRTPRS